MAAAKFAEVRGGTDPAEIRHETQHAPTLDEFFQTYLERYTVPEKRPRSVVEDKRLFRNNISPLVHACVGRGDGLSLVGSGRGVRRHP